MSGGPLRPEDLHKIADDIEIAKLREAMALTRKADEEAQGLREAFMATEVRPNAMELLNAAIRRAAEQNKNEFMVMSFPSDYCLDQGRAINNGSADWPESLQGRAKRAYEFYVNNLKDIGYKASARVIDYPGGMPGNIGLFLRW
jgi:DNA mismatch repair ATPase MutS